MNASASQELKILLKHLDQSVLALVEWDHEFRLKRWSGGAERLFGWKAEEVLGKHFGGWNFVFGEDRELVNEYTGSLLSGERNSFVLRNRNYTRDGRIVYCEWYATVVRDKSGEMRSIASLAVDRTHEEQVKELMLQASEAAQIGFWESNPSQNTFYLSEQGQRNLGFLPGEFDGTLESYKRRLHPLDRELPRRHLEEAGRRKVPISLEFRVIWPDGSTHWVEGRGRAYCDSKGRLIHARGTNVPIDERKRVEKEREELLAREQAAVRIRDEFFSIASHELRTPLTPLKLQIRLMERMPC